MRVVSIFPKSQTTPLKYCSQQYIVRKLKLVKTASDQWYHKVFPIWELCHHLQFSFLALLAVALFHFSLSLCVAVLRLHQVYFDAPTCKGGNPERLFLVGDYSSSAEFFVTIGVFSFLYSMAALSVYCFILEKYRENSKGAQIVSLFMTYTFSS